MKKKYLKFVHLWFDVQVTFNDDIKILQKFQFDFLLRLILTLWEDLKETERTKVNSLYALRLKIPLDKAQNELVRLREGLPSFSIAKHSEYSECLEIIGLLDEFVTQSEARNSYTMDEAILHSPDDLNLPPEDCIRILNMMGHSREKYKAFEIGICFED